jgi:5-formyltetrahydrofolate cyclo-ligase
MTEPLDPFPTPPTDAGDKSALRKSLRAALSSIGEEERHRKSVAAGALLHATPEFRAARVVMLFLSVPGEIETASIALRCWQEGKTVVVPKVSWDQRRMMPMEIHSLTSDVTTVEHGPNKVALREPIQGTPMPAGMIDLVLVPALGYTPTGQRIGRGMGFYDRFLAQRDFLGVACGLAFEDQVVEALPTQDHDQPVGMLVTDRAVRRFASYCMER